MFGISHFLSLIYLLFHPFTLRLIGFLTLTYTLTRIVTALLIYTRSSTITRYVHGTLNSYVLITGATSPLGVALADELSHHGFNIILQGHDVDALDSVQKRMTMKYPRRHYKVLVADALSDSNADYDKLIDPIRNLNITVLINALSSSTSTPRLTPHPIKPFHETPHSELSDMLDVNVRFTMHFTRALLPVLLKNEPACVMNVGSHLGHSEAPYLAAYGASKGWLKTWSRGLAVEMKDGEGRDVDVVYFVVAETLIDNEGHEQAGSGWMSWLTPSADVMAKAMVHTVGCGDWSVTPYVWHLALGVVAMLPNRWHRRFVLGVTKPRVGKEVSMSRGSEQVKAEVEHALGTARNGDAATMNQKKEA